MAADTARTTGGFSIEQWLRVVGYSQYSAALRARGYVDYERCVNLSEEDIRAVGVSDSNDNVWRLMERVKDLSKLSEEDAVKLLSVSTRKKCTVCIEGILAAAFSGPRYIQATELFKLGCRRVASLAGSCQVGLHCKGCQRIDSNTMKS